MAAILIAAVFDRPPLRRPLIHVALGVVGSQAATENPVIESQTVYKSITD
jgi:hypothetical protein